MFSVEFSLIAEKSVRQYFSSLVRVCRQPAFYHVFEPDYPTLRGNNAITHSLITGLTYNTSTHFAQFLSFPLAPTGLGKCHAIRKISARINC